LTKYCMASWLEELEIGIARRSINWIRMAKPVGTALVVGSCIDTPIPIGYVHCTAIERSVRAQSTMISHHSQTIPVTFLRTQCLHSSRHAIVATECRAVTVIHDFPRRHRSIPVGRGNHLRADLVQDPGSSIMTMQCQCLRHH
jgi:hypothetical protein